MQEHPNATLARQWMKAMEDGNYDAMNDAMADDVVWHMIGAAEPTRGKEAMMKSIGSLDDFQFTGKVHDVVANDDHTIALVETTVTHGGKSITYRTAEITHIKDGKVTERWAFSDDTDAINKFFSS
jgi:ketosteroid isomerase-like protein